MSSGWRPFVTSTISAKIIVVAPTTAVPMSAGFAVALAMLPAPLFSSRKPFAFAKSGSKLKSFSISYDLRASLERDLAVKAHDRHRRDRLRQSIRKLETLVGELEVQRTLYQVEGVPGVPYLAPLEGVLALCAEKLFA